MMAYVESFARAMERARASVSYWDRKTLDHLQAAHDAEIKQLSKSEYHRGFEDSKATRDADQWQLDRERKAVAERLRKVVPAALCGSHESLSAICKAIQEPVTGWTVGACESLRDRLIYLLGGKSTNNGAETSAKVVKNGEKYQLATYDVLGNERHRAVCELRKMRLDTGTAIKKLAAALGIRWNAANTPKSCALIQSRLIHLLGGDDETASNDDRTCPIAVQSPSITDELRKFAETFRYEWYDEKDGSVCYTTSNMPPTIDSVNGADYINGIADRIDEQFERICSQHESVLQQTIGDTVDEHEREMAELRADYERATKLQREYGEKVVDLQAELRAAKHLHECNQRWCDALLDLIRDAAKDYRTAAKVARRLQERAFELRHERDELLDKLQAISVLCEQDDG